MVDQDETTAGPSRRKAVHLIILIHGLYGSPANLITIEEEVKKASNSFPYPYSPSEYQSGELEVITYTTKSFTGSHTWDGIDINAHRASMEIDTEIQRLKDQGREVVAFSIMAYSLGGLVARYLVGLLRSREPSFFEKVKPVCFSTCATPHLGVLKYQSKVNTVVHTIGRRLFSRSGAQMYLLDREVDGEGHHPHSVTPASSSHVSKASSGTSTRPPSTVSSSSSSIRSGPLATEKNHLDYTPRRRSRPLLDIMSDPTSIYIQALRLFPRVLIVANGAHDLTVPYPTASISISDPFEGFESSGLEVVVDEDHIVKSWNHSSSHTDEKVQPVAVRKEYETKFGGRRMRPRMPPILFLPYPFTYVLVALLPIILPLWFFTASCILVYHTFQSRRRHRLHQTTSRKTLVSAEKKSTPDELSPLLSTPNPGPGTPPLTARSSSDTLIDDSLHAPNDLVGNSHSKDTKSMQDGSEDISPIEMDLSYSKSTISPPEGVIDDEELNFDTGTPPSIQPRPGQIPLLLTPRQRRMAMNINDNIPQLERMISWFPWAFNAHPLIIARDPRRFKFHEEGRGVVRQWAEYVVNSPREIKFGLED